jgi:hypothetical protein
MIMTPTGKSDGAGRMTIDDFVADLSPVRPIRPMHGMVMAVGMLLCAIVATALFAGLRDDIMAGDPHIMVVQRTLVLALLGGASLVAAVESVQPRIGARSRAWTLGLFIALLFPVSTLFTALRTQTMPMAEMTSPTALWCLGISLSSAVLIGTTLTLWARRGAVTTTNQTAWLIGLCAGAFGTMAYSLHCPSTTLAYVGIWYSIVVGISAVAGRLIIPPLLRW